MTFPIEIPRGLDEANLFVTGGAGTLGRALAQLRAREKWRGRLTVYSTSPWKHAELRREFPDVVCVQGDIRNLETLRLAMAGHDVVIHAAAVKYIPDSEVASMDTIDVNVYGSQLVCQAAREVGVRHCLGISTDKACHPANAYGASKMLMEKIFQEYARGGGDTLYHLVRYGNVLESVGSVVEAWRKNVAAGKPVKITNTAMTRFWLSPTRAAEHVVKSLGLPSGRIYVPYEKALSIGKLFEWTVGYHQAVVETIPMRPGEKLHETLLTDDELEFAEWYRFDETPHFVVHPSTAPRLPRQYEQAFTSRTAPELTEAELEEMLHG
jgi:UDP-N-acetylglucosamine 4,6-dehydratase